MPRVTQVKKALKDQGPCSKCGTPILKGQPYSWFQFAFAPKTKRCPDCYPQPRELTRSEWQQQMYGFEDTLSGIVSGHRDRTGEELPDAEGLAGELRDLAEEVRAYGEEQTEKKDNMPEWLQEGDTGQLLEERAGQMEEAADELEAAADLADQAELVDITDLVQLKEWAEGPDCDVDREEFTDEDEYLDEVRTKAREANNEALTEALDAAEAVSFG